MKRPTEDRKLSVANFVAKIFGIIMVVLYMIIGTTIIFKAHDLRNIPYEYAVIFGISLILYGIFRACKLYRRHHQASPETES